MSSRTAGVAKGERFEAPAGTVKSDLVAFVSGDDIHWKKLRPDPGQRPVRAGADVGEMPTRPKK